MRSIVAVCIALIMIVPVTAVAQSGQHDRASDFTDIPVDDVTATDIQTRPVHMEFNAPTVIYGLGNGGAVELELDDMMTLHVPGLPALPYKTETVELPANVKVTDVTATHGRHRTAYLPSVLETAPAMTAIGPNGVMPDVKVSSYYDGARFPADWFTYEVRRGLNSNGESTVFVNLFIYPVYYEGPEGRGPRVTYIDDIDVEVRYTALEGASMAPRAESYDMVIIGPDTFSLYLQTLAEHKTATGLRTKYVKLADVYSGTYFTVQGRDDQEKIKYFIKDALENWGIKYVLLGGDVDMVPVRHVEIYDTVDDDGSQYMDGKWVPSDFYYSDIYDSGGQFDDWDGNGNGVFGEWEGGLTNADVDDPDLWSDVYIGRIPASSSYEMSVIVQKVRDYENNTDWSWFFNAGLAGVDTWANDGSGVAESEYGLDVTGNILSPKGFVLHKMYATKGTLSAQAINDHINAGVGLFLVSAHGAYDAWGDESILYYDNGDMTGLNNGVKLPMGSQSSCNTGGFDDESVGYFPYPQGWTDDSMSEQFLQRPGGGYIGDIGSARLSFGQYGYGWAQCCTGYYEQMNYKALVDGQGTPGRMLSEGRRNYMKDMGTSYVTDYKHVMEFNLMGDPSVAIGGLGLNVTALSPDVTLKPGESAELNFSVKNIGAWAITANFFATTSGPFTVSVSPSTMPLGAGAQGQVTMTVTVNSDAIANVEAPVVLSARSSFNDRATSGSIKVKVGQIFGMTLGVDSDVKSGYPNDFVAFTLQVNNGGNGPDGAAVSITDAPLGWGTQVQYSHVDLPVQGQATSAVTLGLPGTVLAGSYYLNVSATLDGAPISRTLTLRVDVLPRHEVSLSCTVCTASVDPGKSVDITFDLQNKGNVPDDIVVNGTVPEGWTMVADASSYHLGPYSTQPMKVTITAPSKALAMDYPMMAAAWAPQATAEASLTITVNRFHGLDIDVEMPAADVDGGKEAVFSSVVTNLGNGPEDITIETLSVPDGWMAQGGLQGFTVQAFESFGLDLVVTTKFESLAGTYDVAMRARATTVEGVSDDVGLKVTLWERIDASADLRNLSQSALPGKTLTNTILFQNDGNVHETVSLSFGASEEFVLTALDQKLTVNSLTKAETAFTIKVKDGVLAGPHNYTVSVQRSKGPTINLTGSVDVLQYYKLDLVPIQSGRIVKNGGTLTKKMTVTNMGNGLDTFTVGLAGNQSSWARLSEGSFKLAPGQSKEITVTITPPKKAAPERHELAFTARSSSGVSKASVVDFRVQDSGTTTTEASSLMVLPWLLVALAVGFVVGRVVLSSRKDRYRAPPPGW